MALLELCAVCENGLVHSSRSYPIVPGKLYARECTTTFRANNLLHLLPNEGNYRGRIIDCYFNAPTPIKDGSARKKVNAYLRIDDLFADGWRRTDHSNRLYHSRVVISDSLHCDISEPTDAFLPINTSFMTDRLSKELVFHIDQTRYIRSSKPPKNEILSSFNVFSSFRKPIILFVVIEILKDDTIQ